MFLLALTLNVSLPPLCTWSFAGSRGSPWQQACHAVLFKSCTLYTPLHNITLQGLLRMELETKLPACCKCLHITNAAVSLSFSLQLPLEPNPRAHDERKADMAPTRRLSRTPGLGGHYRYMTRSCGMSMHWRLKK